ncbi:MAG: TIGR03943 family putative permease subunit [Gemmataceae bacterium]
MAHDHDHAHDPNTFYLDQLFTIAVCGALAAVTVLWWWSGAMTLFLVPNYHLLVLFGGLLLLSLVVIRAAAVWRSVDEMKLTNDHDHCGHDHDHCHHEHEHGIQSEAQTTGYSAAPSSLPLSVPVHAHDHDHEHDHDHDHEHGWAPWRYVVLLLPVVLYFLNLPNQGFSADAGGAALNDMALNAAASVASKGRVEVGFGELQQASLTQESRDYYKGMTVTLTGQYSGNDPKRFGLTRFKMACCAADAVPLKAIIMVNDESSERVDPDRYRNKWVEVTGRILFFQKPGTNEHFTGLILYPTKNEPISQLVKIIPQPATPWLN